MAGTRFDWKGDARLHWKGDSDSAPLATPRVSVKVVFAFVVRPVAGNRVQVTQVPVVSITPII